MYDLTRVNFSTFTKNVIRLESGCWQWLGKIQNGYGVIGEKGRACDKRKSLRAHRYSFECFRYSIPEGLTVDHLCRNRACVNPFHMEIVTRGENVLRGDTVSARNKLKTHCPRGHPYSEENTYNDGRSGRRCRQCAREYNRDAYHGLRRQPAVWNGRDFVLSP